MKLAAGIGRVNLLPEQLNQLAVRENIRVKRNLNRFDMPGRLRANLLIGGINRMSACISGNDPFNSR
ncbi:hypothetical protein D3C86_2184880 [compost metagenome]